MLIDFLKQRKDYFDNDMFKQGPLSILINDLYNHNAITITPENNHGLEANHLQIEVYENQTSHKKNKTMMLSYHPPATRSPAIQEQILRLKLNPNQTDADTHDPDRSQDTISLLVLDQEQRLPNRLIPSSLVMFPDEVKISQMKFSDPENIPQQTAGVYQHYQRPTSYRQLETYDPDSEYQNPQIITRQGSAHVEEVYAHQVLAQQEPIYGNYAPVIPPPVIPAPVISGHDHYEFDPNLVTASGVTAPANPDADSDLDPDSDSDPEPEPEPEPDLDTDADAYTLMNGSSMNLTAEVLEKAGADGYYTLNQQVDQTSPVNSLPRQNGTSQPITVGRSRRLSHSYSSLSHQPLMSQSVPAAASYHHHSSPPFAGAGNQAAGRSSLPGSRSGSRSGSRPSSQHSSQYSSQQSSLNGHYSDNSGGSGSGTFARPGTGVEVIIKVAGQLKRKLEDFLDEDALVRPELHDLKAAFGAAKDRVASTQDSLAKNEIMPLIDEVIPQLDRGGLLQGIATKAYIGVLSKLITEHSLEDRLHHMELQPHTLLRKSATTGLLTLPPLQQSEDPYHYTANTSAYNHRNPAMVQAFTNTMPRVRTEKRRDRTSTTPVISHPYEGAQPPPALPPRPGSLYNSKKNTGV